MVLQYSGCSRASLVDRLLVHITVDRADRNAHMKNGRTLLCLETRDAGPVPRTNATPEISAFNVRSTVSLISSSQSFRHDNHSAQQTGFEGGDAPKATVPLSRKAGFSHDVKNKKRTPTEE